MDTAPSPLAREQPPIGIDDLPHDESADGDSWHGRIGRHYARRAALQQQGFSACYHCLCNSAQDELQCRLSYRAAAIAAAHGNSEPAHLAAVGALEVALRSLLERLEVRHGC